MVRIRRVVAVIVLLVALAATVGVLDPMRPAPTETTYPVRSGTSAATIYRHGMAQFGTTPHTAVKRWHTSPTDTSFRAVWIEEYNPQAGRYHGYLYTNDSTDDRVLADEAYLGRNVRAERLGYVQSPSPTATVSEPEVESKPLPDQQLFEANYGRPHVNASALVRLRENETTVVLGTNGSDGYANAFDSFAGTENFDPANSTYRVYVEKETGRIVRIEWSRPSTDFYLVQTFGKFDRTPASRPAWVPWNPLEVVYDALTTP